MWPEGDDKGVLYVLQSARGLSLEQWTQKFLNEQEDEEKETRPTRSNFASDIFFLVTRQLKRGQQVRYLAQRLLDPRDFRDPTFDILQAIKSVGGQNLTVDSNHLATVITSLKALPSYASSTAQDQAPQTERADFCTRSEIGEGFQSTPN